MLRKVRRILLFKKKRKCESSPMAVVYIGVGSVRSITYFVSGYSDVG